MAVNYRPIRSGSNMAGVKIFLFAALLMNGIFLLPAQSQSPIPGASSSPANSTYQNPASVPNNNNSNAPLPGGQDIASIMGAGAPAIANPFKEKASIYRQLPLTASDAETKVEELSKLLESTDPAALKDTIYNICDWMQDCADAHWKMYKAFEKSANTKTQAQQERETALKFSGLKNRAKLLKADLFIKQGRYPEALSPLVDIVVAEPSSDTGQKAYKRLVEIGFSEKLPNPDSN